LTSDKRNTISLDKKNTMNNFSKQNENKKKPTILMVLFFVLFVNVAIFGQTTAENNNIQTSTIENNNIANNTAEMGTMKQEAASDASNMNFVLWFMGSKQTPNANVVPAGTTAKKQFITSGTAPNRLLIKAFLKKAVNFESAEV
jgi:cell division protein FtsB